MQEKHKPFSKVLEMEDSLESGLWILQDRLRLLQS
ncbi:hypothetical protein AALP_AAs47184U000200 [Arabis alpina]|uniref:Uncharacterized protein n=1 Tax=Arabis alpina TaxID=50452 RepID=A0A087FYD6_ARAAL|nr:hypothetical protein AALP_AAs47184U000200 [Arabis alpina]